MDIITAEARALESLCQLLESADEKVILKAATEILRRITAAQRLAARKDSKPAEPPAPAPAPDPVSVEQEGEAVHGNNSGAPGPAPRTPPPPASHSLQSAAPHRRNGSRHPLVSDTA